MSCKAQTTHSQKLLEKQRNKFITIKNLKKAIHFKMMRAFTLIFSRLPLL